MSDSIEDGESFRNVEYLQTKNGKLESIEWCAIQLSIGSEYWAEVTAGLPEARLASARVIWKSKRGARGSIMSAPEVQDHKAIAGAPRIAFKAKGNILFLDLAEVLAVHAEGNYVSLRHRHNPYLVRESLSSMADKLRPFGFIRIHRSIVVNVSAVEQIKPLPTGEYRLRLKGGNEYLVTRTYKHNLRVLAQLWVGSERLCARPNDMRHSLSLPSQPL